MSGVALAGRGAVVTGGGRGIGAAVARALAGEGARVVVVARSSEEIEKVAAELRPVAPAWAIPCDVTDEDEVRRLGRDARAKLGRVEILVNNAGGAGSAPLSRLTRAEWDRMMTWNATSVFLCTREFAPEMAASGWGRVVNVASIAGLEGGRYVAHYSASKHAVVGFTRSVALELAGTGVTVNAVCPAYVETDLTERALASVQAKTGRSRAESLAAVLATTGQSRLIRPEEVAAEVLRLCTQGAAEESGRAIVIQAGGNA